MDGRKYLSGTICLRGEDGTEATFEEIQKFGEGAACISYEARKNGGNPGVLKEFYPHPTYDAHAFLALNRQENGQLLPSRDPDDGDFCAYFRKVQQDFEDCHRTLQKKRREERNKDLDKFLPAFELYRGYSADRGADGTTYIWFPGASARVEVTFEDFCKSIQERPREKPGYKLAVAVRAVLSLTKCVMALHAAGLIHRDIKPENFGFMELQKEILTQIPSLFDMDSICSVKSRPKEIIRSVGYTEPEAEVTDQGLYAPRVETDIYSIVASLFHAIIITPETKESGYLYQEKYAGRWQDLVNASDLIQATETNSLPRLRALLARILEKGLCRRRSQDGRPLRYESCEELISDLEKAYSYIVPAEWEKSLQDGQKWVLQELDPDRQKNSTLAIQYHLYEHPLYQYCKQREAAINILIVGFDNCGQRFLDACLQAGQGCGHALHATVLWDQKEVDQKIYLDSRPALGEFFNIDGKGCSNRGESYGWIDFRGSALGGKDSAVHRRAIEKTLRQCRRTFHYVFIDLGTDSLNLAAAEAAAEQMPEAFISYVCEGTSSTVRKEGMLCPVLVREPMEGTALHREIERMAFNVHLVWEKSWNRDDQAVKEEFKERYNHDACVAYVLSLKYTLHRYGISLGKSIEAMVFEQAAWEFLELRKRSGETDRSVENELIAAEHRRWVTEKLCLGWQSRVAEDCWNWSTKDTAKKRHVCIVRSRADQGLTDRTDGQVEKWDWLSDQDWSELDPLDQMTLELHRFYRTEAQKARENNPDMLTERGPLLKVRPKIAGSHRVSAALQEWWICCKELWNGDRKKVGLYTGLRSAFLETLEELPEQVREDVQKNVEQFSREFAPLAASMAYQNLKQEDVALIREIPFILTYTTDAEMVVPYVLGQDGDAVRNVAAATMVNPGTILYLIPLERKPNERLLEALKSSFSLVIGYLDRKGLRARVDVLAVCQDTALFWGNNVKNQLDRCLRPCGKRVGEITSVKGRNLSALREVLCQRQRTKRLFGVEINGTALSKEMRKLYDDFPYYRFCPESLQFREIEQFSQCGAFCYIRNLPRITVAEMGVFWHSSSEESERPEFQNDYQALWEQYTRAPNVWKKLCIKLSKVHSIELARFTLSGKMSEYEKADEFRYILPFGCFRAVAKIVERLKKGGVAGERSQVTNFATDACEVLICGRAGDRESFDMLFSQVYLLMCADAVSVHSEGGSLAVKFDTLNIDNASVPADVPIKTLLSYLVGRGYILNFRDGKKNTVSFTYGSLQIKRLLTNPGKLLEIYTYHSAKKQEWFDDVASSYEITWENEGELDGIREHNELDCVLTKGFITLLVECKAAYRLKEDFYIRLKRLADRMGGCVIPVLVADTRNALDALDAKEIEKANKDLIKDGNRMGVVTIHQPGDLDDIGRVLRQIVQERMDHEGE